MEGKNFTRRKFIEQAAKAGVATGVIAPMLPSFISCSPHKALAATFPATPTPYTQQPLAYKFSDLNEAIDPLTMEIHYTKHAAGYAKNLAEATAAEGVNTLTTPLENVLANISAYSVKMRNNAGGHYNHELFWKLMGPDYSAEGLERKPKGSLLSGLQNAFGSFENFATQFGDSAKNRFGSGWAWLVLTKDKALTIGSTPNQDNPLMNVSELQGFPVLGLDVWEHAYYLRYQNKRQDYIANWWKVVNWDFVTDRYDMAMK